MGWFGRAFGNLEEKPGNIAGFAVIASFLMFVLVILGGAVWPTLPRGELYATFASIITLALGYLFGRSGR